VAYEGGTDGLRVRDPWRARETSVAAQSHARPGRDAPECNVCLVALHHTFATFTMRSGITPDSLRVAEPDGQRPRYGIRMRTGHQTVSDDKSHEDAPRHRSPPKRLKRTPASSSAYFPSSRGPAKKRRKEGQGQRHTRKDKGKAWSAEAILEESDSQYLIKYEPVEEGAQCEISRQPKGCRLLVQGRNLQSLHYTVAVSPMSFCPQAASFHTPILPSLSKRKSAFDLCCLISYIQTLNSNFLLLCGCRFLLCGCCFLLCGS
jgi:hypothetical protein